jgi:hypothetical protein
MRRISSRVMMARSMATEAAFASRAASARVLREGHRAPGVVLGVDELDDPDTVPWEVFTGRVSMEVVR